MLVSDNTSPSFIQTTELAGDPEETQLRVKSDPKSDVVPTDVMVTEAGGRITLKSGSHRISTLTYN